MKGWKVCIAALLYSRKTFSLKQFKPYEFETPPLFVEQFHTPHQWISTEGRKVIIDSADGENAKVKEIEYSKSWSISVPTTYPGFADDYGLLLTQPSAFYGVSTALPKPITFSKDETFVLQYEVKLQEGLECGGAYIRLFRAAQDATAKLFRPERLTDKSAFSVMFGPQRCGSTDKVHFSFLHLNKKTGAVSEKKLIDPPMIRSTKLTTLYTLIVRPDGSYEIKINREKIRYGFLQTDLDPPMDTPAEIDDPTDDKPQNWVDEAKIPDPTAVKPHDWNDKSPKFIPDKDARMPEGWLFDELEMIPDPKAVKPSPWSDEEDGEWEAPLIVNPKCRIGCGQWTPPMITNPAYRGEWKAPLIDNPAYRGAWRARQIPNPDYYAEDAPSAFLPANGVGFELFTMQSGILFDNILIANDEQQAADFAAATWERKYDLERIALERHLKERGISNEPLDEDYSDEMQEEEETMKDSDHYGLYERHSAGRSRKSLPAFLRYWRNYIDFLLKEPKSAIKKFPLLTINTILLTICLIFMIGMTVEITIKWLYKSSKGRKRTRLDKSEDLPFFDEPDTQQRIQKSEKINSAENLSLSLARPRNNIPHSASNH